jgi:hypothetical protein
MTMFTMVVEAPSDSDLYCLILAAGRAAAAGSTINAWIDDLRLDFTDYIDTKEANFNFITPNID